MYIIHLCEGTLYLLALLCQKITQSFSSGYKSKITLFFCLPVILSLSLSAQGNCESNSIETFAYSISTETITNACGKIELSLQDGIYPIVEMEFSLALNHRLSSGATILVELEGEFQAPIGTVSQSCTINQIGDSLFYSMVLPECPSSPPKSVSIRIHIFDRAIPLPSDFKATVSQDGILEDVIIEGLKQALSPSNTTHQSVIAPRWKLYPNPASGNTNVRFSEIQQGDRLVLTGMSGNVLREIDLDSDFISIDLNRIPEGLYFLTWVRLDSPLGRKKLAIY